MTVKDRVNKYRAKLRAKHCQRFEVCLHLSLINALRDIAKRKKVCTGDVVEDALFVYAHSHLTPVTANPTT